MPGPLEEGSKGMGRICHFRARMPVPCTNGMVAEREA